MGERTFRNPSRPLILVAVVATAIAAAAVAVVLVLARGTAVPAIAPPATIAVRAGFEPGTPEFGDRIDARIVIALNNRTVRPQTLRYSYGLAPLSPLGAARSSRSSSGDLDLVTVVAPVACLTSPCVARKGVTALVLPRLHATVLRTSGASETVTASWPTLAVRGRVLASDLASASPRFEANTSPPTPSYGISPSTLATLLDVVAVVAAVGAVALLAWQALVFARRRPARRVDPLERALRLARQAEGLPVPHRRRALGLLARLLGRDRLSSAASDLAWSEHRPEPDELEELVSEIERGRPG